MQYGIVTTVRGLTCNPHEDKFVYLHCVVHLRAFVPALIDDREATPAYLSHDVVLAVEVVFCSRRHSNDATRPSRSDCTGMWQGSSGRNVFVGAAVGRRSSSMLWISVFRDSQALNRVSHAVEVQVRYSSGCFPLIIHNLRRWLWRPL